jgi:hypothetical protein
MDIMKKNKAGRPLKISNGRNIIFEAFQALPEDGSPIRFKDLRKNVNMSSATLSKALFYLCLIGRVKKFRVPSQKGKGIVYLRAPKNKFDGTIFGSRIDESVKGARERLIGIKTKNENPGTILGDFEYIHAWDLCFHVGTIASIIIDSLKYYADSNKNQKDAALEGYLFTINGMIKELLTELIDEPLGMSDFTYGICHRSCEQLPFNTDDVLGKAAKVMGWDGVEGKFAFASYPIDKYKELLTGGRLEMEKEKQRLTQEKEESEEHLKDPMFNTKKDKERLEDTIKWCEEEIKRLNQFIEEQKQHPEKIMHLSC